MTAKGSAPTMHNPNRTVEERDIEIIIEVEPQDGLALVNPTEG